MSLFRLMAAGAVAPLLALGLSGFASASNGGQPNPQPSFVCLGGTPGGNSCNGTGGEGVAKGLRSSCQILSQVQTASPSRPGRAGLNQYSSPSHAENVRFCRCGRSRLGGLAYDCASLSRTWRCRTDVDPASGGPAGRLGHAAGRPTSAKVRRTWVAAGELISSAHS
jgi:hypothetical protein